MSKKCMFNRNENKKRLVQKYAEKKKVIKKEILSNRDDMESVFALSQRLASFPRSSSKTRVRNRCQLTGRSRGNLRYFGLCRNEVRRLASFAEIPGLKKSSW